MRKLLIQQSSDSEFTMFVDGGTGQGWGARMRIHGPHSIRGCGAVEPGKPMQIILRLDQVKELRDWLDTEVIERAKEGDS